MSLQFVRRIRGSIHGSVDVTPLEDMVIAHPYFQRLRRIKQTAFLNLVFPGASHSRFEHSIGVMHLAGTAWQKIRDNQNRLRLSTHRYKDFESRERSQTHGGGIHGLLSPTFELVDKVFSSSYVLQCLRLAGLMHDLGHPPFSHSGERFLPDAKSVLEANSDLPAYLKEFLQGFVKKNIEGHPPKRVSHEVFTIILIWKILSDINKTVSPGSLSILVDPKDVISIIAPQILPSEQSELFAMQASKLCNQIVSGEVDVDRMDYLTRDSKEGGVVYGIFDGDRILDSLSVYYDQNDKNLHLALQFSGLAAFEDYLRARQSMYLQLYFHKTSIATEAMLQRISSLLIGWSLPAKLEEYCNVDENNIAKVFEQNGSKIIENQRDRHYFEKIIKDLLFDRNLWKRVFEISGASNAILFDPTLERAEKVLDKLGVPFEKISSSSSLTKFRARKSNQKSSNYLRLIKKDSRQFPRVVPIEDYCGVFKQENSVHICRLYIDPTSDHGDMVQKVREKLIEELDDFS